MSKRKKIIIIVIVTLLFIVLIGSVFFYLSRASSKEDNSKKQSGTSATSSASKPTNNKNAPSQKNTCPAPTFTSDETDNIASWKTFENSAYTFKYPETWTIASNEANFVNLKDSEANINLEIRSGNRIDDSKYSTYTQQSSSDITVNCRAAKRNYVYSSSTNHAIYVLIFKEGSTTEDYTISMDFDYVGASISGDIIDAFDTLLKTLTFK